MASIDLLRSQYPNTPDDILLAAADMQDAEASMPMRGDLSSESAMRKFAGRSDDGVKTSDAASGYPGVSDSGDRDLEDVLSSMGGIRGKADHRYQTDDPDLDEVLSTIWSRGEGRPSGSSVGTGFKRAFAQLPELGYGAGALAGMTAEKIFGDGGISTGVKDYFTRKYQEKQKENEQYAPGVQFTDAWDAVKSGNLDPLADWLKDTAGYVVGQGVQTVLTGGAGAVIGKTVLKSGTEKMLGALVAKGAEKIVEKSAGKIAMEQATQISAKRLAEGIGAGIALNAQNLGMEAGDIFGELKAQAEKEGREITGDDLARAWGAAGAAALTETATDLLGLGTLSGKIPIPGVRGRAARGAVAAGVGVPLEGGQEYAQTGLEQYGAGKPLNTQEAELERINAAAVGAVGGGLMGAGAGAMSRPSERRQPTAKDILDAPTIDDAVDAAVGAAEPLGLPHYSGEPLVTFPDGSTMTRAEAEQRRLDEMVQPSGSKSETIQQLTPQPRVAIDPQPAAVEQLKRDEIDAAFKQQEAERNAQKIRDIQAMRREQLAQQADAESQISLANDQQPSQITAMQLAMDLAKERNRAPASKPVELPQESPVLSLGNSRRGSPVITGPAEAVKRAEPYIRSALPGETIFVQKAESGAYALVFGRNADREKIREVIANIQPTQETPLGNERRGPKPTTQETPNGLQVQGQATAQEVVAPPTSAIAENLVPERGDKTLAIETGQTVDESTQKITGIPETNGEVANEPTKIKAQEASIDDIPPRILKKVKVKVERMVGNEVKTEEISATEAISDIDQEISAYESLLKCLRSAA